MGYSVVGKAEYFLLFFRKYYKATLCIKFGSFSCKFIQQGSRNIIPSFTEAG